MVNGSWEDDRWVKVDEEEKSVVGWQFGRSQMVVEEMRD